MATATKTKTPVRKRKTATKKAVKTGINPKVKLYSLGKMIKIIDPSFFDEDEKL